MTGVTKWGTSFAACPPVGDAVDSEGPMWKRRAAVSPLHLSTLLTFPELLPAPAVRAQETGSIAGVVTAQ